MGSPNKVSDEEFIRLFRENPSPSMIARITGLSERRVHIRRRTIESRYGITLKASITKTPYAQNVNKVWQSRTNIQLGIENGCVIVFSDAHFMMHRRTTAFKALLWLIEELKPKVVINNGDAFDGASISRHPVSDWDTPPSVLEELKACEMYLGEIEDAAKLANKNVKLVWCTGNHDSRMGAKLAAQAPQFKDVKGFKLEDHFPEWEHTMSCLVTDNLMVKHRWRSGEHAASLNAKLSGMSFVTGHLHALKISAWTDLKSTRWGVDTGTLAEPFSPAFSYTEDSPRSWRSGFAVLNIVDGHLLAPEIVMVSDAAPDSVEWRGGLWDVSEF